MNYTYSIQQIKDNNNIVEVVKGDIPLKKRGQNYVGLSPLRSEKTPSFSVNPEKQIFKDFGSGEGGDVIDYIRISRNMSFRDAVKYLADRAGLTGENVDSLKHQQERRKRALERLRKQQLIRWRKDTALQLLPVYSTVHGLLQSSTVFEEIAGILNRLPELENDLDILQFGSSDDNRLLCDSSTLGKRWGCYNAVSL